MKNYSWFIFIILLGCGLSCKKNQTSIYSFEHNQWHIQDSVDFMFPISDTSKTYDISIFFRNTLEYPYRNLYLLIETNYTDSIIKKDTIQYRITDKYGNWVGRGLGNIKDNYFVFERAKQFHNIGEYRFTIMHGMRNNKLIGCNKIGVKVRANE